MALLIDNSQRRLLPTWKELNSSLSELQPLSPSSLSKGDISSFIHDWRLCKNLANAGDLISAAIINARTDIDEVIEAANYVLFSEEIPSIALSNASKSILKISDKVEHNNNFAIYAQIAKAKNSLIKYPTDAIMHIEIARNYLLLGQIKQAQNHVETALYLDHHNRYVVRCAARFYIHLKDHERALRIVRASLLTKSDPWLMASEIGISQIVNKTSNNIKRGLSLINSDNFNVFDITELCSAIGTQELMSGAYSKSRKLLNTSLKNPNSNSLAQAKWISNEDNLELNFENVNLDSGNFWEAKCYNAFKTENYLSSLDFAKQWINQEPYSTRAILHAYSLSVTYLHDLKSGQEIMESALKTHIGNPTFINNYAYTLALDDQVELAENIITKVKRNNNLPTDITDICITATRGMIAFRKGDAKNGSLLYLNAIDRSRNISGHPELNHSALLNFCRELLIYDKCTENKDYVKNIVEKIPLNQNNKELSNLREQINALLVD